MTLRGGGVLCSHANILNINVKHSTDDEMLQNFLKDVGSKCEEIQLASNKIGLQESKDQIIDRIKWFITASQFINQINRNPQMINENIKIILDNLKILLSSIQNIIQSQMFLALQLLNICNQFSRLIFIYYVNNPQQNMNQDEQASIQQQLNDIQKQARQEQQNSYQNSICYQQTLISMCIDTCPTDSLQGQDILINTFNGILSSITDMTPTLDLLEAIGNGALFLAKEYKKKQQLQIFQIIFYLEELKWQVIEELQKGIGINKILAIMSQNYNQLVLKSNIWIIKCCWIKIICELMIYKPIITKSKYEQLTNQYQLTQSWEEALQQQLISTIDSNKNIGIIQNKDITNKTGQILNIQVNKLEQFKQIIINGHQDIPKLQNLIIIQSEEQQDLNNQKINKIIKFQQLLESLPLIQLSTQFQQFIQNLFDYSDAIQEVTQETSSNTVIVFDQIQQLTILNSQLVIQQKELDLNGQILNLQLINISQMIKPLIQKDDVAQKYLLYFIFKQYFEAIQNNWDTIKKSLSSHSQKKGMKVEDLLLQFIEKLRSYNLTIIIQGTNEIQLIIKQLQVSNIKQSIIFMKQQLSKYNLEINIKPLHWLSLFLNIMKEFKQIFEQELRNLLINQNILLQDITQSKSIEIIQKIELIKFYQMFHFIFQMNTYNQIKTILNDLKFDENTMIEVQQNKLSDLMIINFSYYALCIDDFNNQKNLILNQFSNTIHIQDAQESLEYQSRTLKNMKQLFIKYEKWQQEFLQHIKDYQLKETFQINQFQEPQIIQQLKQNFEQLRNLSDIKQNQQDLISTINQRIEIFQNYLQDIKDQALKKLIQREISYYKFFIDDDYLHQVSEKLMNDIEINQKQIILMIQSQQNQITLNNEQEQIVQEYIEYFDQLTIAFKKLFISMDQASQGFSCSSQFVFQIGLLGYSNQPINDEQFLKINEQFTQSLQLVREVVDQNFKEVKQTFLNFNPNQLPLLQISDEFIYQLFPSYKKLSNTIIASSQTNQNNLDIGQKLNDLLEDDNWRIKEYFYFNCVSIHSQISNQTIKSIIGQLILYGKYKETDIRIISTLKNKDIIQQIELLISNQWEDTKNDIHSDLQITLNQLQVLQLQLQGEERKLERDKILQKHKDIEQQLEQQMQNVNEISDVLGITIHFLKDIRKDLGLIQNKLDNILETIEEIGQDIKFLRGKSPQQLLEIRMEQVLQNQIIQDAQSVYIQMWTKEYRLQKNDDNDKQNDNNENNEKDEKTPLFNYEQINTGEIDEFLLQESKSSLLIHGPAGAGKSLTARKIEEYLWKMYQLKVNNQKWDKVTETLIVPIFIQLPALKDPKFSAIEETLKSTQYKFDQKQVDLFKDIIQGSDKLRILFIMDSYDELAKEYQQINLIQTNKINQWKKQTIIMNPKVVTTSRSEIFTNLEYRKWFYGDEKLSLSGYKEIRLLPFDETQRNEFLYQFSWLQLKLQIKELLEIISKKKHSDIILQDTINIFQQIKPLIQNKSQQSYLVNNSQSQQVLNIIKQHPNVIALNNDQELSFNKQIQTIWSAQQYHRSIQQMDISEILETPFMMNIVVEVLPQMNEIFSSQNYVKSQFQQTYIKNKHDQILGIIKMHEYGNQYIKKLYNDTEIKELQQINESGKDIQNESQAVWEYLVNYNFFKQFSAQLNQKEILQVFNNIQNQTQIQIPFSILKKERDVDNQVIVCKALTNKNSSLYDFYQVFLQNYIEKQRQKQIYNTQINDQEQFLMDIHQFAQRLAVTMTKQNDTIVEMKIQGVLFRQKVTNDPYQEFFQDQDKYANYRKLIIKCLPIKQKSNFFSFNHKSIQEYLFAKDIIELLSQINEYKEVIQLLRKQKNKQEMTNPIKAKIKEFIQQSSLNQIQLKNMPAVIKFIKAGIQQREDLQDACYHLSLLSSIFEEFIVLSSNALLIYANVMPFTQGKDFSGIIIENINLDQIIFINCDFSYSRFKMVGLIGINLNYSNLSNINWVDCYANDMPALQFEKVKVQCACFSNDEKQIISGSSDGYVRIWDKQIGKLLKEFYTQSNRVPYVSVSDDGQIIITVNKLQDKKQIVQFWNSQTSNLIAKKDVIFQRNQKLISHYQQNIVIGLSQFTIQAYDFQNNVNINSTTLNHNIQNLQLKQGTNLVYILQIAQGTIEIWDFILNSYVRSIQFTQQFKEIENSIKGNLFTSDCQLYSYRYCSSFVIFNTESQKNTRIYYPETIESQFYFSEDKKYIAFSQKYGFQIMDSNTQQFLTPPLFGFPSNVTYIKFSKQSKDLIVCYYNSLIKFWDLKMLQTNIFVNQDKFIQKSDQHAQFSWDGLKLYIKRNDKLFVYNPYTAQLTNSFHLSIDKFLVRPNGKQIIFHDKQYKPFCYDINLKLKIPLPMLSAKFISQSYDGLLYFYKTYQHVNGNVQFDEDNYQIIRQSEGILATNGLFSNENKNLFYSYIVQFDEDNFQIIRQSEGLLASYGLFSYDNKILYYSHEKLISSLNINLDQQDQNKIFQKGDIQVVHNSDIISFQLNKDGNHIVFLDKFDKVYVWDLQKKNVIHDLGQYKSGSNLVQFHFNNKHLIISDQYNVVILDSTNYIQQGPKLKGHKSGFSQLVLSPNGSQFVTLGDQENTIKVWDFNEQEIVDQAKKTYFERLVIPQNLSQCALINKCNFNGSEIHSHLGYNLLNIWIKL